MRRRRTARQSGEGKQPREGLTGWDRLLRDLAYVGCAIGGIPIRPLMEDSQPSPAPALSEDELLWRRELDGMGAFPEPAGQAPIGDGVGGGFGGFGGVGAFSRVGVGDAAQGTDPRPREADAERWWDSLRRGRRTR